VLGRGLNLGTFQEEVNAPYFQSREPNKIILHREVI